MVVNALEKNKDVTTHFYVFLYVATGLRERVLDLTESNFDLVKNVFFPRSYLKYNENSDIKMYMHPSFSKIVLAYIKKMRIPNGEKLLDIQKPSYFNAYIPKTCHYDPNKIVFSFASALLLQTYNPRLVAKVLFLNKQYISFVAKSNGLLITGDIVYKEGREVTPKEEVYHPHMWLELEKAKAVSKNGRV
jgi:hypothetical protein